MLTGEVKLYPEKHEISFSLLVKLIQWYRGHSKGHSKRPGIVLPPRSGSSLNDMLLCLIIILKIHVNPPFKFPGCWYTDQVCINLICLNHAVEFAQTHPHNWLGSSRQSTLQTISTSSFYTIIYTYLQSVLLKTSPLVAKVFRWTQFAS